MTVADDLSVRLLTSVSRKDWPALKLLLCENAVLDYPAMRPVRGRAAVVTFLRSVSAHFESLEFQLLERIGGDEKFCLVWTNSGRRTGGALFENRGVTLVHVDGGQIGYLSDYFKADIVDSRKPTPAIAAAKGSQIAISGDP